MTRHVWLIPVGAFVALLALMLWLSYSSRPTVISIEASGPDHLVVDQPSWRSSTGLISGLSQTWDFTVTNISAEATDVSLVGLSRAPESFEFSISTDDGDYGPMSVPRLKIPPGESISVSIKMHLGDPEEFFGHSKAIRLRLVEDAAKSR
ncbi:MAG: hypothetical protein GEU75_13325 [Dehalococcoidia bacterium]|nr:hypothetical protein [Dehalococcoidia bacterium]